jgi:hypothetical protein
MKSYLNFLFTKRIKTAIIVIILLIFSTYGAPSNTGWHSVSEIEEPLLRESFRLFINLVTIALLFQVNSEFLRPKQIL